VGCRTGVQSGQIKVRALLDEATVFGAKCKVLGHAKVAHSIQRRCLGPTTPSGLVKHRNPTIANTTTNSNVTMRTSLRSPFNHTHCERPDFARYVSCYRSFVMCPLWTSKPIRNSAAVSRAISFAHETPEPLPRQRKFP
jgi:hypothetical protein